MNIFLKIKSFFHVSDESSSLYEYIYEPRLIPFLEMLQRELKSLKNHTKQHSNKLSQLKEEQLIKGIPTEYTEAAKHLNEAISEYQKCLKILEVDFEEIPAYSDWIL